MPPQTWITFFNILSFTGALLVVISSIGAWHFGNKLDNEKDKRIAELIEGKNELLLKSNSSNKEALEIKRLNNLMLKAMENTGQVKLNRDSTGKVIGFVIELAASAKAEATAGGELNTGEQSK